MRLKFGFLALFLLLVSLPGSATDLGLYVERLNDPNVILCPYCGRPIVAGKIHENAEGLIATEMGEASMKKGSPIRERRAGGSTSTCSSIVFRSARGETSRW